MIRYELKKIYTKTSSKIAVVILFLLLGITCYLAIHGVGYVNEEGKTEYGIQAVQKLKAERKEWAGVLSEEVIARVIEENARINATEEYQSNDVQKNDIAFSWKQGFYDIRKLLVRSFCAFRDYDYYVPDALVPADAAHFYSNRILHLQEWLDTEAKDSYSKEEKEFFVQKYKELETPFLYDYAQGWIQLLEYAPTVVMIMVLILGFLAAGIFSGEFQVKADAIFYSAYHGRGKAVAAKLAAGVILISVLYWVIMLLYSAIVLGILGIDGAKVIIQTGDNWKSFYNITYGQEYLLTLFGGYLGSLFILLLTMLVSAKTKSTVLAVVVPFILIFIPSFLSGSSLPVVSKILGLLPDQLLQMNIVVGVFNLYQIGGKMTGALSILLVLYSVLSVLVCPLLFQVYRRAEVK